MNTRIEKIIKESGLKKVQFANTVGIDQSYVTKLISGEKTPSDRVIDDICEKITIDGKKINKEWLLTGNGDMFPKRTREQEIGIFADEVMDLPDEDFKKRLIIALSKLDEKHWKALEDIIDEISKEG